MSVENLHSILRKLSPFFPSMELTWEKAFFEECVAKDAGFCDSFCQYAFPLSIYPSEHAIHKTVIDATLINIRERFKPVEKPALPLAEPSEKTEKSEKLERTPKSVQIPRHHAPIPQQQMPRERVFGANHPMGKPIRLMSLIHQKNTMSREEWSRYIPLEVQHVEVTEQQQEVQQVQQVQLQVQQQAEQQLAHQVQIDVQEEQQVEIYRDELIDEAKFYESLEKEYITSRLSSDFFANLPHAIKYFTPEAARVMRGRLFELASLNKDNLPDGFFLQKTPEGEWVLDYDRYRDNENTNVFTPCFDWDHLRVESIYAGKRDLVPAEYQNSKATGYYRNLYLKYGEEGVADFEKRLDAAIHSPERKKIIKDRYLAHYPEWEYFYDHPQFFSALAKVGKYDALQFRWFQIFTTNNGSSHYDFAKTVAAFDFFWSEWEKLCEQQQIPVDQIDNIHANMMLKFKGNPVVYMERLLLILKQSRNLKDFLAYRVWTSPDNLLELGHNDAYYAVRYEGFRTVSPEMKLVYNGERNKKPFNKDAPLYRVEMNQIIEQLENKRLYKLAQQGWKKYDETMWWIDCSNPLQTHDLKTLQGLNLVKRKVYGEKMFSPWQLFYQDDEQGLVPIYCKGKPEAGEKDDRHTDCFRLLGTQTTGMSISTFRQCWAKAQEPWEHNTPATFSLEFSMLLIFVTHERFHEDEKTAELVEKLIAALRYLKRSNDQMLFMLRGLKSLYQLDIKLNCEEGLRLSSIAYMNSAQTEGKLEKRLGKSEDELAKIKIIEALFEHLRRNKFAVYKMFELSKLKASKYLFILDTAAFLAEISDIERVFADDLLLFASKISKKIGQAYHRGETDQTIIENVSAIREILLIAATQDRPNNFFLAIQMVLSSQGSFTYSTFLAAFNDIRQLPVYNPAAVRDVLQKNGFDLKATLPSLLKRDSYEVRRMILELLVELKEQDETVFTENLVQLQILSVSELIPILEKAWNQSGLLVSAIRSIKFLMLLKEFRNTNIQSLFGMPDVQGLLRCVAERLSTLPSFQDCDSFEKLNQIVNGAEKLKQLFQIMLQNPHVMEQEENFAALFGQLNFSSLTYESLYALLTFVNGMPQRNYLSLLTTLFADKDFLFNEKSLLRLLDHLSTLHQAGFPTRYLNAFIRMQRVAPEESFDEIVNAFTNLFLKDPHHPLLELLMTHPFTSQQSGQLVGLQRDPSFDSHQLTDYTRYLIAKNALPNFLALSATVRGRKIAAILCKAHRAQTRNQTADVDAALLNAIAALSDDELNRLHVFYETMPASKDCLLNALQTYDRNRMTFEAFLITFEREPWGKCNLADLHAMDEVERVINGGRDLLTGKQYSWQYRKQMMESFQLVNEMGFRLPVFNNKPAWLLINAELRDCFQNLKTTEMTFQKRLQALALMRVAMYRSTGEFAYSTQVIAIIDAMMHQRDFASNIDTGQGKSLIDLMKSALLWLDSDSVACTTSSIVDGRRDIANYGSFLKLLDIPYSPAPLTPASPLSDYQSNGINISTFAKLKLFRDSAKMQGIHLDPPRAIRSLVINELDQSLLDDREIYRYAVPDPSGITVKERWIYYAINAWVSRVRLDSALLAYQYIDDLKAYLVWEAQRRKKSSKVSEKLENFSDENYLMLIESALLANHVLEKNVDYVIPPETETVDLNGLEVESKVIRPLQKEGNFVGKASPDASFGNGVEQLIYAKLNVAAGRNEDNELYVIRPQYKAIISSNNRNVIDEYRQQDGFIWGSSATVGSLSQIRELAEKYGLEFSSMLPHQANQVIYHDPVICANEQEQFQKLIGEYQAWFSGYDHNGPPEVIFWKDIATAERFHQALERACPDCRIQLYLGVGKEEDIIQRAAQPGMITITTSAIGRNTDIDYEWIKGLRVRHTFADTERGTRQKVGRTGRRGSPGEVFYYINQQELGGRSIEEVRRQLEGQAKQERDANEAIFNVIGYLFARLDEMPEDAKVFAHGGKTDFIRKKWASFSRKTEQAFRHSEVADREELIRETLEEFRGMTGLEIQPDDLKPPVLNIDHPETESYQQDVKLADCRTPVELAWQLFDMNQQTEGGAITPKAIQEKLTELFEQLTEKNAMEISAEYLSWLGKQSCGRNIIQQGHERFLNEYLRQHSEKPNAFLRAFGRETRLNQLSAGSHFLLMCQGFTSMHKGVSLVEIDVLKESVIALIDDYLETNWFYINEERRRWAANLKTDIQNAADIERVIQHLSDAQISTAKKDAQNGSLHFFGKSRFQETLSRALNLSATLSGKTELPDVAAGLTDALVAKDIPTLDELKLWQEKAERNDAVILSSLENVMSIQHRQPPTGMTGRRRHRLFGEEKHREAEIEEKSLKKSRDLI